MQKPDVGLTFVVRSLDGTLIGSSSYLNVDGANRRLEIGNTWYVASARRSGVNSETKLLMLGHAFDELGCVAVEFRTHFFNFTSRAAIERLGAKLDGVLRSHRCCPTGRAATPWCTRSSISSGRRCATICDTGWSRNANGEQTDCVPPRDRGPARRGATAVHGAAGSHRGADPRRRDLVRAAAVVRQVHRPGETSARRATRRVLGGRSARCPQRAGRGRSTALLRATIRRV